MSTGLPSLYRRGTDIFGRRKIPLLNNKSSDPSFTSLPPIPSVNDLLAIGRDEIASMNDLKDSLKCIKKLNNSSRLQHHRVKQTHTFTSKQIEMFLDSEQASFDEDDTENEENNDEGQIEQEQGRQEDNEIEDSEIDHPSFEEDEEDSEPGFSDFITLTDSEFNAEEVVEQNEIEVNLCENNNNERNNIDSQVLSSSFSQDNTNSSQIDILTNPFDLLQQASLEEESNIHQIDDALSFVSSIVCNTVINSSSTSNSPSISPSPSNSNSRSNSALVTPRSQSSRNNSARSTHGSINRDISESTNHQISTTNTNSPRLNPNPHFHALPSRRIRENSQSRNIPTNTTNLLNFLIGLNS